MLRAGPVRPDARRPRGEPARHRPRRRSSRASPRCCARRPARSSWRRSRSWPTSPRLRGALDRARERRHGAGRPPPAALEQLVDAQPAEPARAGHGPLHAARAPRRRRAARAGRRRRARACARAPARSSAGRGDGRGHARRGVACRTAGATAAGHAMGVAAANAGVNSNVLADESLVDPLSRQRRAERHPGRGGARGAPSPVAACAA